MLFRSKIVPELTIKEGSRKITLDNYNPQKCSASESKDGYTKDELYLFGVNELKIPQTELIQGKNQRHKSKDELCAIINKKIRSMKSVITDADRIAVYQKDLNKCKDGESKGGYKVLEVREMAINYFDLDEETARKMDKPQICDYIIPIIKKIKKEDIDIPTSAEDENIGAKGVYPGDIRKCNDSTKKGGMSSTKLKKIAAANFGIDPTQHKEEICKQIEAKLKEIKESSIGEVPTAEPLDESIAQILKEENAEQVKEVSLTLGDLEKLIAES